MQVDIILKSEMNYHILVYVIILLLNTYDLKSTVIVPVRPYGVKGGINDSSLDIYTRLRKKVIFSPPNSSFDYKNVSLSFLGPVLPLLAPLYLSQASHDNKLTLCPPLCLTLNSFPEDKES